MLEMLLQEEADIIQSVQTLEEEVVEYLLPHTADDMRNAVLEVRAGVGGDEAAIFTKDMFEMYQRWANKKGWEFEILDISDSDQGGYKEASAMIRGENVFKWFKYESGVHRVQRIPATESHGRVHTSAMTVAILPEAEEVDVQILDRDLRIDTYRAGGKGGQHVNKTESAVRITHIPTGTVVAIQDERDMHRNKAKAMSLLRSRIYEAERVRKNAERDQLRSSQIGGGDRSERIRTYNYPQGRVTDHRINSTKHGIEKMMSGEADGLLDEFVRELATKERIDAIQNLK